jgi:hypothetical protein
LTDIYQFICLLINNLYGFRDIVWEMKKEKIFSHNISAVSKYRILIFPRWAKIILHPLLPNDKYFSCMKNNPEKIEINIFFPATPNDYS